MDRSKQKLDLRVFRWLVLFTILVHSAGLFQLAIFAYRSGFLPASNKWMLLIAANAGLILVEGIVFLLSLITQSKFLLKTIRWLVGSFSHLYWLNLFFSLAAIASLTYLVLSPSGHFIPNPFTRFSLFWLVVCANCFFLKAWSQSSKSLSYLRWIACLGISLLLTTFFFLGFSFFQDISDYPYTLSWSEASRYYYASLFFSERIYGFETQPTVLHPSRYLMQAIPFLIQNSPVWLHRAWQVLLWITTTLLTSILLIKRAKIGKEEKLLPSLAIAWSFIYLLVGPVYYHLQIPLILVLWGFNRKQSSSPTWRWAFNILILGVASAWAGISRVNWFPVPGLLASLLFFIEQPINDPKITPTDTKHNLPRFFSRSSLIYGFKAISLTVFGTIIAFSAQYFYIQWSGNSSEAFKSSFSSDLLWYRLWPSSTYIFGILPGAILVSIPLFMMIWGKINLDINGKPFRKTVHPIRWLGLATILLVLFLGGLVVSVKIGGGSNLHNLDAYLALLLVATVLIIFERVLPDQKIITQDELGMGNSEARTLELQLPGAFRSLKSSNLQMTALVLSLIAPIAFTLFSMVPSSVHPIQREIDRSFKVIRQATRQMDPEKNEVLFLSNRHLLTFGYVEDIRLVPEYERVFLMEMAMSGTRSYLDKFHEDLANQRFGVIITEPIFITEKSGDLRFGEENNAWVEEVSKYLLCYYKARNTLWSVGIQIYIPREKIHKCE